LYEIPYSAVLYIIIKALKGEELHFENKILLKLLPFSTIIKAIPAGLTIVFVLINNNESFFLHVILGMALLFCMFGDIGMEKGLIPGLLMFLVGQILFIVAFVGQALTTEINIEPLLITAVVTLGMIVYIILFLRYLESSEKGLGEFRIPVLLYCVFLSGMFLSTFLLWMSSGVMELGIVVLGGLLFVISDSIIAIREFHHQINYSTLKVMTTYYSAIFLLSLASLIQFS